MPVLKMLSRRKLSAIQHTLNYITREEDSGSSNPILHNLRSRREDKLSIVREFIENEAYRKITSNRIYCYHTILSMGEGDKQKVTPQILEALAQKYFELRGDVIAYAIPHFDTGSSHLHILESGTMYRENKASGLRKRELHQLKLELEALVKEKFPELEHSMVVHGTENLYTKENEYQLQKRSGTSEREQIKGLVHQAYHAATSTQSFLEYLLNRGYAHYERNSDGVPTGIISESGRKFRFKILSISSEKILQLENVHERSREQNLLDQLQDIRQNNKSKNREL